MSKAKKSTKIDCNHTILEYVDKEDWRINANANTNYSHASLVNNSSGKVVANFWLDYVYSPEEGDAHRNGDYHIHDLDILAPYCFTADTMIATVHDGDLTFGELVDRYSDKKFEVWAKDENGKSVIATAHSPRVTRENAKLVKVVMEDGYSVRCTPDHLFRIVTPAGFDWKEAQALTQHDMLLCAFTKNSGNQRGLFVKEVQQLEERENVYDLTVDKYHNFALSNGVIVHNCCGHDFQRLLQEGFNGVRGRVNSKPPKHLSEALYQLANFLGILQAEWAGAQAVSSFDTYLAPYLFFDKFWEGMNTKKLKRVMRNFVYNLNVPSRWGQCVPESYKCLKADGTWVTSEQLQVGDEIFVIDMENGKLKKDVITNVNVYNSPKKLHQYTNESGFKFSVTKKHRVIYKDDEGFKILNSSGLAALGKPVSIPTSRWVPVTEEEYMGTDNEFGNEELEFVAYILSCSEIKEGKLIITCKVNSYAEARFVDLCKSIGVFYDETEDNESDDHLVHFTIRSGEVADKLINLCTVEDGEKRTFAVYPEFVQFLSQRQANIIIDEWSLIAGSFNGSYWTLNVKEQNKKEMLAYLTILTGKSVYIGENDVVYVYKRGEKECEISEVPTTCSKVWCPTTETGTFICMTDEGYVFLTGNSPFTNVTIDWTVPQLLKDLVPSRGNTSYYQSVKDEWFERKECPETRIDLEEKWGSLNDSEKESILNEEWKKFEEHAIKRYEEVLKEKFEGDSSEIWLYLTYSFFQKEMNEINNAFYEVLNDGDEQGLPFTFPIPTINITEDFDWDGENTDLLFENTAKMGSSYFQNFIGSQYKRNENGKLVRDENAYSPNDVRSMCCRLQLDKKQLRKRGGGLFGSDSQTGCYDEQTEVLTKKGWKLFKDLTLQDELYTLNSDMKVELHKPKKLFQYEWDGDLLRIKTRTVDLFVTPNHRMVTISRDNKQIGFCYAEDIKSILVPNKTEGINKNPAPPVKYIGGKFIKSVDWCAFLGWYISEGCCYKTKGNAYSIQISQSKHEGKMKIRDVLQRLPFKFYEYDKKFVIYNKDLFNELSKLGKSDEKYIPDYVFSYDKESLTALYDALIDGDGTKSKENQELHSYFTISKRLADDVQRLMIMLGYGANCSLIQRKTFNASHFKINRSISECRRIDKSHIHNKHYKGYVYCAEVENHTMCVRRNGRAVWCGNSIGVVTLNMARLGYKHKNNKEDLYNDIDRLMDMAKSTLEKKRKFVTDMFNRGLYPYTRRYVRTFDTYFSTIGVNGMNEMVKNFTNGKFDITSPEGQKMCLDILQHIRERLISFQEETGNLYNLEATPAEGTMRRFAHLDKEKYPDILQAGFDGGTPYYTNSSQLPVDFTADVFTALDLQDDLQKMYTGGTVLHLYMRERVSSSEACKHLVKSVLTNYRLPYISVTPTFSVCPIHGRLEGEQEFCPKCDAEIIRKHAEEVDTNL